MSKIFEILATAGQHDYVDGPVSQLEHALQAAYFAKQQGARSEVIVAALLHDIGHFCAPPAVPQADGLDVFDHESVGADFLRDQGMCEDVQLLVGGHVVARRYLAGWDATYRAKLSSDDQETLEFEGGPLTPEEQQGFERTRLFEDHLIVRRCDDAARQVNVSVPGLASYRELVASCMNTNRQHGS